MSPHQPSVLEALLAIQSKAYLDDDEDTREQLVERLNEIYDMAGAWAERVGGRTAEGGREVSFADRIPDSQGPTIPQASAFEHKLRADLTAAQNARRVVEIERDELLASYEASQRNQEGTWEELREAEARAETAEAELREERRAHGVTRESFEHRNRQAIEAKGLLEAAEAQADQLRAERDEARKSRNIFAVDRLKAENEQLREALERVARDIRRRLAGDDAIDAPFDEDLSEALQAIARALASTTPAPVDEEKR